MNSDANCRSCKAPVRWVLTMPNNKRMPLDPEPASDGNIWVDHHVGTTPVVQVALTGDGVPRNVPLRYVSHFVTCPDRDYLEEVVTDERFRVTVRGDDPVVELRGYVDHWSTLERLCSGLKDYFGNTVMVVASVEERPMTGFEIEDLCDEDD